MKELAIKIARRYPRWTVVVVCALVWVSFFALLQLDSGSGKGGMLVLFLLAIPPFCVWVMLSPGQFENEQEKQDKGEEPANPTESESKSKSKTDA